MSFLNAFIRGVSHKALFEKKKNWLQIINNIKRILILYKNNITQSQTLLEKSKLKLCCPKSL